MFYFPIFVSYCNSYFIELLKIKFCSCFLFCAVFKDYFILVCSIYLKESATADKNCFGKLYIRRQFNFAVVSGGLFAALLYLLNKIKDGNYAEMQTFIKRNRTCELKEFCL